MAIGVNSILYMGTGALFSSSAGIQVTGDNIPGVSTPGSSRQTAALHERYSGSDSPAPGGLGVRATEVMRHFDAFIESHYVNKLSAAARWQNRHTELRAVDDLFGENSPGGLESILNAFFDAWDTLAQGADTPLSREVLLGQARAVATTIREMDAALRALEERANAQCAEDVGAANSLMREIAQINTEISGCRAGRNSLGKLMNQRAEKVRELATVMDIAVEAGPPGNYAVAIKDGATLVRNDATSALEFRNATAENRLTASSPYRARNSEGGWNTIRFSGADRSEYTVEIINDGEVGGGVRFRLSIDGGSSWLTNDEGDSRLFNAGEDDAAVLAGALEIWFDPGRLASGDRFVISPKSGVYWSAPASEPLDEAARICTGGVDAPLRVTGGSLGGLLEFRDDNAGEYRDRLNALAKALADGTTGLAAAFGLDCFFTDGPAASFDINQELTTGIARLNAERVNANGEINTDDNRAAGEIAAPAAGAVPIGTLRDKDDARSIFACYSDLVIKVGSDTRDAGFSAATETAIARELYARQEEISGVNLDEEMSSLIKFQASYKAAAKLITTADGMLQTLLSLRL